MRIVYMLTDVCNIACPHCYKKATGSLGKNVDQCEAEVSSFINDGHSIILAGREVLCEPEKLRLYKLAGQDFLLTNGIIIAKSPKIIERLHENNIKKIFISWHYGFTALAEQVSEDIIRKAITNARKGGIEVYINCVVGNVNHNLLDVMSEKMLCLGVNGIKFIKLIPLDIEMSKYALNESQQAKVINDVVMLRDKYDKDVFLIKLHANFNAFVTERSLRARNECVFCEAGGKDFVTIDTDNAVYPCPFLSGERFKIGSFIGGKIMLDATLENDGRSCLIWNFYK